MTSVHIVRYAFREDNMSRITWTVLDVEATTDRESTLCTITLVHDNYTAYVSARPRDGVPRYDILQARKRGAPALVWPREDGTLPDKRTPLHKALTELRERWDMSACAITAHAYLGTHSAYCEDTGCSIPVHLSPAPGGTHSSTA